MQSGCEASQSHHRVPTLGLSETADISPVAHAGTNVYKMRSGGHLLLEKLFCRRPKLLGEHGIFFVDLLFNKDQRIFKFLNIST